MQNGEKKLLTAKAAKKIREEVRRFKQLMEAGEIPSVEGQSSGRESQTVKG